MSIIRKFQQFNFNQIWKHYIKFQVYQLITQLHNYKMYYGKPIKKFSMKVLLYQNTLLVHVFPFLF